MGYDYNFKNDSSQRVSDLFPDPTGSQLHHVLRYLHQISSQKEVPEECITSVDGDQCTVGEREGIEGEETIWNDIFDRYQFAFQPAMSMYDR
jgi:hypothetical protein